MHNGAEQPFEELFSFWRERSMLPGRTLGLRELFELGEARRSFVCAIDRHTGEWRLFRERSGHALDGQSRDYLVDWWVEHCNVDVPWMRSWAWAASLAASESPNLHIVDAVHGPAVPTPDPDLVQRYAVDKVGELSDWDIEAKEFAPDPTRESRKQFLRRMATAYDRRVDQLDIAASKTWRAEHHADWFVRYQIGGESYTEIFDSWKPEFEKGDETTISKAVKKFAKFIDLPPRGQRAKRN